MAAPVPPDDEDLYALLREEAWLEALGWLHRAWRSLDGDARARHAAEVFDEAFFEDLEARPPEALERRLMLHHGRMRALSDADCARLSKVLARKQASAGNDRAAQSMRRVAPEDRSEELGEAVQREAVDLGDAALRVTRVGPAAGGGDARASLFKSEQERVFFELLRKAFPTHVVYPNAALSAVLDYDRLQAKLSQAERDYFFRALVDAVVVDLMRDARPVYFFELDSAYHDHAERRRNDRLKDAILAKAGQTLYRLRRPSGTEGGHTGLEEAIRAVVEAG